MRKKASLTRLSDGYGFFQVLGSAKVVLFAMVSNACTPNLIRVAPVNASVSGFISRINWQVLLILLSGDFAKIRPFVVRPVSVPMVNKIGPSSFHPEESKTMGPVKTAIKFYNYVSDLFVYASSNLAKPTSLANNSPSKDSGILVVMNKFAQAFCANMVGSHEALLKLIDQRPRKRCNRLGASSLYRESI